MCFLIFNKTSGPKKFIISKMEIKRTDIFLKNKRGLLLACSHFEPIKPINPLLPCVIYLHGNSSSRLESLPCIEVLLPLNITLFCFDFSGCGLSEGEYISLGYFERDDVSAIINYLRNTNKVSTIGLWGRSMGAVTSIMHSIRDPSIGGMVLDSPFMSLKVLAEELCRSHTKIPKTILDAALKMIRKTILQKAGFDILELEPIKYVKNAYIPAFFIAGKDDIFIKPNHSQQLCQNYAGDKNIVLVEGDHNDDRPEYIMNSIAIFFYNSLQCESLLGKKMETQKDKASDKKFYKKKEARIGNERNVEQAFQDLKVDKNITIIKKEQDPINNQEILQNFKDEKLWNELQFFEFSKEEVEWNDQILDKEIVDLLDNADLLGLNSEDLKGKAHIQNKKEHKENSNKEKTIPPSKNEDLLSLKENDKGKTNFNILDMDFFYEEKKGNN